MATVNVYLTFDGNCKEVFDFYQSIFKKEFLYVGKFGDMPSENPIPEEFKDKIMHVSLPISTETVLMGSDLLPTPECTTQPFIKGNNFSISVNAESQAEADALYNALSAGGVITMPLEKTFWNAYFGMFTDQFGINWMINYDFPADNQ